MTFSGHTHRDAGNVIRLDLAGDIRGTAVGRLHLMLVEVIVVELPAGLIVNLGAVTYLSDTGIVVLTHGCVIALEYGTGYCVVDARDQPRRALQDRGVLDWLADSDDLGALALAVLFQPRSPPHPGPYDPLYPT